MVIRESDASSIFKKYFKYLTNHKTLLDATNVINKKYLEAAWELGKYLQNKLNISFDEARGFLYFGRPLIFVPNPKFPSCTPENDSYLNKLFQKCKIIDVEFCDKYDKYMSYRNNFFKEEQEANCNAQIKNLMTYNYISEDTARERITNCGFISKSYQGNIPDSVVALPNRIAEMLKDATIKPTSKPKLEVYDNFLTAYSSFLNDIYQSLCQQIGKLYARNIVAIAAQESGISVESAFTLLGIN